MVVPRRRRLGGASVAVDMEVSKPEPEPAKQAASQSQAASPASGVVRPAAVSDDRNVKPRLAEERNVKARTDEGPTTETPVGLMFVGTDAVIGNVYAVDE